MVIDKIRKMSVKGVKLKSESYFSISPGVLELWRKTLGGNPTLLPRPDRVNPIPRWGGGGGGDSTRLQIVFFITHVRDSAEQRNLVTFLKFNGQ